MLINNYYNHQILYLNINIKKKNHILFIVDTIYAYGRMVLKSSNLYVCFEW